MSRTLGRARWWLMAALGVAGLCAAVTLGAQSAGVVPAENSTTLLEVIIVGLGGWGLLAIVQLKQTATQLLVELRGVNGRGGLVETVQGIGVTIEGLNATVEGMKRWMPAEEGARLTLNQSVSRIDGDLREVREVQHRLVAWAEEVGVPLGRPFAYPPDTAFHPRREREAG